MKLFQFLVTALLLVSSTIILAEKPDPNLPNPPLATRDANVDGNDWIRVHEQGTAKVEVQGVADVYVTDGQIDATITGGEVEVNNTSSNPVPVNVENFPDEQDVYVNQGQMSVVTRAYSNIFSMASDADAITHTFANGPIYATTIHTYDGNDESYVEFFSPMAGDVAISFSDADGAFNEHTHSFTYPIPISGYRVSCANESEQCLFVISVFGF